jgi:hypothetical protein
MQVQPRSDDSPSRLTKSVGSLSDPKRGGSGFRIRIRACRASTLINKEALSINLRQQ